MRRLILASLVLAVISLSCGRDSSVVPRVQPVPVEGDEGAALFEWAIGPIEGITTAWHPMPSEFAVPVGTTFRLRCASSPSAQVVWSNAEEVSRGEWGSIAECHIDAPGRHEITAVLESVAPDERDKGDDGIHETSAFHSCVVNGIDAGIDDVAIVTVEPRVSELLLTESSSNYETMKAFLTGGEHNQAISLLRRVGPDHYRTAINRHVALGVTLADPRFSSLIETRISGERPVLGMEAIHLDKPGRYRVSVGPPARAKIFELDTYKVTITSHHKGRDVVQDGVPVTFVAQTDPPGHEDEITWISSTKYGQALPVVGHGPEFTVEFANTSRHDAWLGVRADNATFAQDGPAAPQLALRQLTITMDNVTTSFSQWGHAELTFTGNASILYFNLSMNGQWPIRNMPVQSVDGVGFEQGVSFGFDLGVTVGTPVTSVNAGWTLTSAPIVSPPAQTGTFTVTQQIFREYYGIVGDSIAVYTAPPSVLVGGLAQDGQKHNNEKLPNQQSKPCGCVPTAVSNSIKFLKAKHGLNIPDASIGIPQMETATKWGVETPHKCQRTWPTSKKNYMEANSIPITTTTTLDINDVIKAIDKGCDVEVNAGEHTAAIVGVTKLAGNKYAITVKHDVNQDDDTKGTGKEGTETGTFNGATGEISGIQWYNNSKVLTFVIECPTGVDPGC